jgi:HEAT repeat protein
MDNSQSKGDLILGRMQVPDESGLFVLGCFERPATVYMQQVRALNLIYALDQKRPDDNRKSMLVIGAGAGGVTAAAAAAALGWEVTIVERKWDVLSLADGVSAHRWLHPHIYDWPADGTEEARTNLGIMDWSAGTSHAVASHLRGEWRRLEHAFKIHTHVAITGVTLGRLLNGKWLVRWNGAGPRPTGVVVPPPGLRPIKRVQQCATDVVILAVGFGEEEALPPEFPGIQSYWHTDHVDVLKNNERNLPEVLVSGTGDGGLIDALRYSFKDFRHEEVLQKLKEEWLGPSRYDDVRAELRDIEKTVHEMVRQGEPHEAELNWRYRRLSEQLTTECARIAFREDVIVFLVGRDRYPLSLKAAPINRFLLTLTNVQYRQAEVISARKIVENVWKVGFKGGEELDYLDVVVRHGPRAELSKAFPDIHAKVKQFRDRWSTEQQSAYDPTRAPLYDETFKASLATSVRAAGSSLAASSGDGRVSVAHLDAGDDPLDEYRMVLAVAFEATSFDFDVPAADRLTAFALKRHANGTVDEQVRLIVAVAGSGKTTLLKQIAKRVLEDPVKVPLFLQLRSFDSSADKSLCVNAIDTALEALAGDASLSDRLRAALLAAAMQGRLVLLLDGLDEMEPAHCKEFFEVLHGNDSDLRRGNCIILASRPLGTETLGLTTVQFRLRDTAVLFTRLVQDEILSGAMRDGLSDRFLELLENAALKSLRGEDVATDLAAARRAVGMEVADERRAADWVIRKPDSEEAWDFANRPIQDLLVAMALARVGTSIRIAGLVFDERSPYNAALPIALAMADDTDGTYSLLEQVPDTLDWRVLMLRLKVAMFDPSLPPAVALRVARDTARVVATPELASIQFVTTLAEACRGLPVALASLLSAEVSNAFSKEGNRELYRAIRFLSRAEVPDAAEKLKVWMMHENDVIADAAAEALGEFGQEDVIPALVAVYLSSTKRMVFGAAVDAIAAIGGEQAVDALLAILENRELYHNLRWPAAHALGVLTSDRALAALLAHADDPSANLRQNIAEALGSYPGRRTVDQLVRMAIDTDNGVRIAVFESLARHAEACDIELLQAGLGDSHPMVRLAAAEGWMRLDRPGLLKSLEQALAQTGDPWREHAAILVGRMLGLDAVPTLVQLSLAGDRYARLGAARALAGSEELTAIAALVRLAGDDDDEVSSVAVESLPVLDEPQIIDSITRHLDYKEVTSAAMAATRRLRGFRNRRVAEVLRRAVLRPDFIGGLAAGALGTVGEPRDIDLIVRAWRASTVSSPFSNDSYAMAIARIGGERACEALRLFLDHGNVTWRLYALYALAEIDEAATVPAILHAWADSDERVRCVAANSLQSVDSDCLREGLKLALCGNAAFVQATAARLGVPYADQQMLDILLDVDPIAWGEDGSATYVSLVAKMKDVVALRQAAQALAFPP